VGGGGGIEGVVGRVGVRAYCMQLMAGSGYLILAMYRGDTVFTAF
jgi:hypothetical protein